MLPVETSGSREGIDSSNKSYIEDDERQLKTIPYGEEKCRNSYVSSSKLISSVPSSMAVPTASLEPGFSHFSPSLNHFQCQFSFPYASQINSLRRPETLNDLAPTASYDSCSYNDFESHFNLRSSWVRNPIMPPPIQQENNIFNMRSMCDDSAFMLPTSQFVPATVPGFAVSVNFPSSRPNGTLEIMQSRTLENFPSWSSCRESSKCEVSGHQIFLQSQNFIDQRLSHEENVLVIRKKLTNSDVGRIGRIVIPKKDAETNFPPLFERDGIMLRMDDLVLPVSWEFKYRFWPNNKSRMYILENTGEFVKTHGLQAGDYLRIHKCPTSAAYFVKGEKRSQP